MENLEFYDKQNMVTYLKKPTGSEGFQEIVDFLNGSHIMYALTKNLTIYISLIEKFWQTATVRTVDNGEQEITATVDGKNFTVTEASVRRHLQLADADDEAVNEEWDDRVKRAATTTAGLDAEYASGNINMTQSMAMPNVPLPQGIGACDSPRCEEAMEVPLLRLGRRGLKLKVKKLVKKKRKESFDDETDFDAGFYKVQVTPTQTYTRRRRVVSTSSGKNSTASRLFSTTKESVSTVSASMPVSTAGMVQEVNINIPSPVAVKDKGKGKMEEFEDERTKRTKLQQEQDRLGYEAAVRLQEELDEEERQRMARVYKATQSFIRKNRKTFDQELKLMKR
uniref:Xylulose kinase-1 n=1 Tax=Tanacetum cinerariifolium TaxID=118510 RepID=A0A6L2KI89_TANCI|nr:xylulose kinase-1 [Tanacetum cinerariifolium]